MSLFVTKHYSPEHTSHNIIIISFHLSFVSVCNEKMKKDYMWYVDEANLSLDIIFISFIIGILI